MRMRPFALALAGALWLSTAAAAGPPMRVALLPIVVHAASAESEYLSEGLAEMLAARLEQSSDISVIRVESNARTTKQAAALEVGRSAGADYVVFGSFTQFGSGASLDVRCARVPAQGEGDGEAARRVFVQSGSLGEIIPKLDTLVAKLRRHVSGRDALVAQGTGAPAAGDGKALADLRQRVDALERAVYPPGAASAEDAVVSDLRPPEAGSDAETVR